MKSFLFFFMGFVQVILAADCQDWLTWATDQIDHVDAPPLGKQMDLLGQFAGISAERMNPEQAEISQRAQSILLAIPGHTDHFAKRLNDARDRREDYSKAGHKGGGAPLLKLVNEQASAFRALGSLPSPETVRVLGDFLSDERGADAGENEREAGEHPNSNYAVRALMRLPIVSKPVTMPPLGFTEDDAAAAKHTWLLWYQQVKAGTRTFRFEGDPNEYSLTGPVKIPASAPPTDRSSRTDSASLAATQQPGHSSIPAPFIAIAATVLAAGAWYAWRAKRRPSQIG